MAAGDREFRCTKLHEKGKLIFGAFPGQNQRFQVADFLVGASGFEPPTSWSRTRRSSQAEPRPDTSSLVGCALPKQARTIRFVGESEKLREIPAVHEVLHRLSPALARFPRALVVAEIRTILDAMRAEIRAGRANGLPVESRVERTLAALERP